MAWLDLVAPSAAILGLFAAIGLILVAIRHGRALRRLEERLAQEGDAATPAPLQRIAELQARHRVSEGGPSYQRQIRMAAVLAAVALVILAAIGGIWYLVGRDGGSSGGGAAASPGTTTRPSGTAANPPDPVETTVVPENVPPVADPSAFTVAIFNASGVTGVARTQVQPLIEGEGYTIGDVANPPDNAQLDESVVMWVGSRNRRAAWNVAKLLGVTRAPPLDGYTSEQVGGADVVVLVGTDLANGTVTPTP